MKLKAFREYLAQFPDDTIVEVLVVASLTYGGDAASFDEFNEDYATFSDLRGNPHIRPDKPYYNKRYLRLGDG